MNITAMALVFGVIFIAELPDKSMFASLALSTRFKKSYVWLGAATAFLVHVIIAVTAGRFLTLLPKSLLDLIVGALFLLGAVLLIFGKNEDGSVEVEKLKKQEGSRTFWTAFGTSFVVIFLGEWGDITQIVTANYEAKYHDVWLVGISAVLGLWAVAALGIFVGSKLLSRVPARLLQRITGIILLLFAAFSIWSAIKS